MSDRAIQHLETLDVRCVGTAALAYSTMTVEVPDTIVCVDCGYDCHRLTQEPEDGFDSGAIVAYRCSGCMDRWDVEFGPEEAEYR